MAITNITKNQTYSSIQSAINAASPGDTINVDVGIYSEAISLPFISNPSGLNITIRSSNFANFVAGTRVKPSDVTNMPTLAIDCQATAKPVILASSSGQAGPPSYFKFQGFEITSTQATGFANLSYYLVRIDGLIDPTSGDPMSNALSQLSHHITFDHCYIHGKPGQQIIHGVALTCGATFWTDCYIAGFASFIGATGANPESQAMFLRDGPGPHTITNCYIEGSTQCLLSGGASAPITANVGQAGVPKAIITKSTFSKPLSWNSRHPSFVPPPGGYDYFSKNILEIKNGSNWTVDQCQFQYGWSTSEDGQLGVGIYINHVVYHSFNGANNPQGSFVNNNTFSNNIIDSVNTPFQIDYESSSQGSDQNINWPSNKQTNNKWINNHCTNCAWQYSGGTSSAGRSLGGNRTTLFETWNAWDGFVLDHNTFVNDPSPNSNGGPYSYVLFDPGIEGGQSSVISVPLPSDTNFLFSNNIFIEQGYGWVVFNNQSGGGLGTTDSLSQLNTYLSPPTVQGNLFYGTNRLGQAHGAYTANNFVTSQASATASPVNLGITTSQFISTNGNPVSIKLYSEQSTSLGFGQAYTGAGTLQGYLNPGCDISRLLGAGTTLTPTTTTLSASPTSLAQGGSVTLTATVSGSGGTPTGSVQFLNGNTVLGTGALSGGKATLVTTALPVGTLSLTAVYQGDTNFSSSTSNAVSVTVAGASDTMTITAPSVQTGSNAKIIVAVSQ